MSPRFVCKRARYFARLSEAKGFSIKCRDRSCSVECYGNGTFKLNECRARLFRDYIPEGATVYRGHLTLARNATPGDHRAAKEAFLLALRRWGKRHGHRVELEWVLDITDPHNAHWDIHLWTDAPYRPLHDFFGKAWGRAGGYHFDLVEPDSLQGSARYPGTPVEPDPLSKEVFLPASQSVLGMDTHGSTRGFWCRSIEAIWRELIEEWKAGPVVLSPDDYQAVKGCPECQEARPKLCGLHQNKMDITDTPDGRIDPQFPCGLHQNKMDITDTPGPPSEPYQDRRFIPGVDPDLDRQRFADRLPNSLDGAIGLGDYARRWGVDPHYMASVLRDSPIAICTNGDRLSDGNASYNAWYRRE